MNEMVEERLSEPDARDGFYPGRISADAGPGRSIWRSGWMSAGIREVVIHLAVDYNIIIARLTGRRQCPRCGTLYNVVFQPPKVDGCVRSGRGDAGDSGGRSREPVIRERLDAYDRQTRPVLEYFRTSGRRVVEVDAERAIRRIWCIAEDLPGDGVSE